MVMIHDGICESLRDVIAGGSSFSNCSSVMVVVVENRKLEFCKINYHKEIEKLDMYVADQTCPLFKFTYWGQSAVRCASRCSPGCIVLIEQFDVKCREENVVEGVCGMTTHTHLLYSKFGFSFQEARLPKLYESVQGLLKFCRVRYPLLCAKHEKGGRSNNYIVRSPACRTSNGEENVESQIDKYFKFNGTQDVQSPSMMFSSIEENATVEQYLNLGESTSRTSMASEVSIKSLQKLKNASIVQKKIMLHADKEFMISIQDITSKENPPKLLQSMEPGEDIENTWKVCNVSKRWKVMDNHSGQYVFVCFESRDDAYDRAMALFNLNNVEIQLNKFNPVLVQATGLLILREEGRSRLKCQNKSISSVPSPSYVQEFLVSEDSILLNISCIKRRSLTYNERLSKRSRSSEEEHSKLEKVVTLDGCCFIGMQIPSGSFEFQLDDVSPSNCFNVKCDKFLWQLINLDCFSKTSNHPMFYSNSTTITNVKYKDIYFFIKYINSIVKVSVDDNSIRNLMGNISAPLLVQALLCPHTLEFCCPSCIPFLRMIRDRFSSERHVGKDFTVHKVMLSKVQHENTLVAITDSCKLILRSLVSSSMKASSCLPKFSGQFYDSTSEIQEAQHDGGASTLRREDAHKFLYIAGSGEKYSIRMCVTTNVTNESLEYPALVQSIKSFRSFT